MTGCDSCGGAPCVCTPDEGFQVPACYGCGLVVDPTSGQLQVGILPVDPGGPLECPVHTCEVNPADGQLYISFPIEPELSPAPPGAIRLPVRCDAAGWHVAIPPLPPLQRIFLPLDTIPVTAANPVDVLLAPSGAQTTLNPGDPVPANMQGCILVDPNTNAASYKVSALPTENTGAVFNTTNGVPVNPGEWYLDYGGGITIAWVP